MDSIDIKIDDLERYISKLEKDLYEKYIFRDKRS